MKLNWNLTKKIMRWNFKITSSLSVICKFKGFVCVSSSWTCLFWVKTNQPLFCLLVSSNHMFYGSKCSFDWNQDDWETLLNNLTKIMVTSFGFSNIYYTSCKGRQRLHAWLSLKFTLKQLNFYISIMFFFRFCSLRSTSWYFPYDTWIECVWQFIGFTFKSIINKYDFGLVYKYCLL